jgi:hypothetical protein
LGLFENKHDVFFIIDVGDHFVEKLRKIKRSTAVPANSLKIHVGHSSVTQADSASKTKPNARVYTDIDNTKPVRVCSWWYNQSINVNGAAAKNFFLSEYHILTQPANIIATGAAQPAAPAAGLGQAWKMRQIWTDEQKIDIYTTPDAHIDNSKPKVVTYLNTHLGPALPPGAAPISKINCSLDMQKKRSGDWLQIWMAYMLPFFLLNRTNFKGMNMINTDGTPRRANSATDIPVYPGNAEQKQEQYKRCTYFVTGDWPAACYAIYRGVNVILVINGSTKNNIKPAVICIHCD